MKKEERDKERPRDERTQKLEAGQVEEGESEGEVDRKKKKQKKGKKMK